MGRPAKETVDYFPHYVKSGRTIFILESKFGNDGYAFWFKLLEILGESEGHYYDCSISNNWEYLLAKTRCDENTANEIIETLISLGKIDGELWNEKRIIWCKNFVDNLSFAYNKRHVKLPSAPSFRRENYSSDAVSVEKTIGAMEFTERKPDKEKKRKGKERKEEKIYPYQDIINLWSKKCGDKLSRVVKLTESRKHKIRSRLDEFGSQEEWMSTIEVLFDKVAASDFLCGESDKGWRASFDWLFENEKNWVKVIEGNYDNRTKDNERSNSRGESQAQAADRNNRFTSTEVPKDYSERF
nr:MAG TPA: protein of unknown function (DUF4373) [Caudoviricetes sp.]